MIVLFQFSHILSLINFSWKYTYDSYNLILGMSLLNDCLEKQSQPLVNYLRSHNQFHIILIGCLVSMQLSFFYLSLLSFEGIKMLLKQATSVNF